MNSLNKNDMKLKDFIQVFKKLKSIRKKKPISYSVIKTFYEQPEKFFDEYHSILENSTFFDYAGNSIFCHLFYVLYVDYKTRNHIEVLNENEKNLNFQIYESKFESFLKEYEKYFLLQDVVLDTPLHKIAKRKDKGFFIELFQKLNKINLISNELLLINNLSNESICTYIINEIKYNPSKIKNEEFYYNFINEHLSMNESLSKEDQQIIKNFSSKIIFELKQYKEENFNEIFNNLNDFINNNIKTPNLFEYIYFPFTSNINYLNCVFLICSNDEDYNKLFNLVSLLSQKKEIINKICISELCIVDHIKYVIRKMDLYNRKSEKVYNYGVKLIKEILSNIMKSKDDKGIKKLIGRKRFKKGLISNIIYNQSLSFDKKIELFDLLNEITKGISNNYIDKKTYKLYRFFKLCEKTQITKSNINNLIADNEFINKILKMNKYLEPLLIIDIYGRNKDCNYESDTYISEKIKTFIEFLNKNYYNLFKYAYNLSDEKVGKILNAIFVYDKKYNYEIESYMDNLNKNLKNLVQSFILSDKNVLEYYLNEWLKNGNPNFIKYLFSSEYDFSHFLDFNNQNFHKFFFNNEKMRISLPNVQAIKGKPFEDKYLAFLLVVSGINNDFSLLLPSDLKHFDYMFNIRYFNYIYVIQLIVYWNYPFDYIKLAKYINRFILLFSKLFIRKKEMFKGIMNEIAPNINLDVYLRAMDIAINACEKYNIPESPLCEEREEEIINDVYLIFILIYIKKKYENKIPNLSVFLLLHLLRAEVKKMFDLFENSFKKGNIDSILNYFYFAEPCYSDEKYSIVDYLRKNNDSFCKTLKILNGKSYLKYADYIKYIKPHLKGYAFLDDNSDSKNIPYRKLTDFDEYLDFYKNRRFKVYFNIRALAYFDIKKRSNDNEEDNFNFNYICSNIFEHDNFLKMLDCPNDKMNKHLYKKIISIIDYASKEFKNKEINGHSLLNSFYLNLYELFVYIEEEKKTFFDILNNNAYFISYVSSSFSSVLFSFSFEKNLVYKDMKKVKYITDKIFEFFKMESEDKYLSKLLEYNKKEFFNSFINKIKQMKDKDKESIKKQYELFLKIENKSHYIHFYIKTIEIFFEKNEEYFYNCLSYNKNLFEDKYKDNLDHLFRNLMNKNVEKFINCIPEFNNLFKNNLNLNKLKNSIIKNIIKSNKYELFFNKNLQNHSNIFSDFDDSLLILNFSENNKNASKYIMNKIKELFCPNEDNQLFIRFLNHSIINQYVFDTALKNLSKKDKNFIEENKSIIFESLNEYCIKNAYYYVDNLLKFLNNYLSMEEIQNLIFTYELSAKTNITNINQEKEEETNNNQEEENEEDKYLLLNCLNNFKKNYETIAVLLNYCPTDRIYLYVFPFLYDIDIFLACEYSYYLDYFSKSKNRDIIKSLNKNFYNISIFLESLRKQYNYISSLPTKVQDLFNYYISINIFQITPRNLLITDFYDFDNEELNKAINQREELLKRYDLKNMKKPKFKDRISELNLFMIFALYEIKGTPLIPINKYLPEFYLKIENYCKLFKSLKIPEICLKDSFDIRFIDYLINNLKNQKVKILKKIEKFPNLIFIIQKEYGNIFDVSESNEDIYYQQLIYNLIENRNIYSFSNDEKRLKDYYSGINTLQTMYYVNEDSFFIMEKNFYQETIFSLKDFTRSSSLVIEKFTINYDSHFYSYSQYLSIIRNICSYFLFQSKNPFENQDKNSKNNLNFSNYDIFVLKEILFQNEIDKIEALKNTININQIKYFIVELMKKHMGLNHYQYIDLAINWLDDYLKLNSISKLFNDVSQISLANYFNYLNLCCEIIINWLRKIEEIIFKFNKYLKEKNYYFHIRFKNNSNEENAKKEFGESLYILGSSIIKNNNYENLPLITISYYLDENMDYIETSSGQELFEFVKDKFISLDLFKNYLTYQNEDDKHKDNQLYLINKAINDKNINYIYELLFSNQKISKKDKNLFNAFKPMFEPIFTENKNFIYSYMKETASITNEPNHDNCLYSIKYKFYNFFSNYIFPCLLFNYRLRIFCEDISYFGKACYKIYINFNEIINSINKTKYHKNKKLNELFKIRAINYVINGDSTFRLQIEELYKFIKNKEKGAITDNFIVKVLDGKEVKNEFNKLKMTLDNNNYINDFLYSSRLKPIKANNINNEIKTKKKLKLKLKIGEHDSRNSMIKENIYFSTYKKNNYKRKNVPSLSYEGYVPSIQFIVGKTKGMIFNDVFRNEYLKRDIKVKNLLNNIGLNEHPKKKYPGRRHFDYREKFVNVFDLMFSIKSISKNEIVVYQNDISSVLEEYYEPNIFISLLNYGFHDKKEKEVQLNMEIIEKYIKESI